MGNNPGLKKQVELLLLALKDEPPLTMGQIMDRANIAKTLAPDVSSALYKLRNKGLVRTSRGPSTSSKGPRFVRLYQWVVKPVAKRVEPGRGSAMAGLGVFRI